VVAGDDRIPIGDGGQYHAGILFDGEGEAGDGGGGDVEAMLSSSRTRCKYASSSSSSAGGAGVDVLMGRRFPNSSPVIIEHCVHILHDSSTGKNSSQSQSADSMETRQRLASDCCLGVF